MLVPDAQIPANGNKWMAGFVLLALLIPSVYSRYGLRVPLQFVGCWPIASCCVTEVTAIYICTVEGWKRRFSASMIGLLVTKSRRSDRRNRLTFRDAST